jgi:hypothetical protein
MATKQLNKTRQQPIKISQVELAVYAELKRSEDRLKARRMALRTRFIEAVAAGGEIEAGPCIAEIALKAVHVLTHERLIEMLGEDEFARLRAEVEPTERWFVEIYAPEY